MRRGLMEILRVIKPISIHERCDKRVCKKRRVYDNMFFIVGCSGIIKTLCERQIVGLRWIIEKTLQPINI